MLESGARRGETAMTGPWTYEGQPPSVARTATLVAGSTFCVSEPGGDITSGRPQGLFARDARLLSRWELLLDGTACEPLVQIDRLPFRATYLSRRRPLDGTVDSGLLVERERTISSGMHERIRLHNAGPRRQDVTVELLLDADLADVFEVKESRLRSTGTRTVSHTGDVLRIGGDGRISEVTAPGAEVVTDARQGRAVTGPETPVRLRWNIVLQPHSAWSVELEVGAELGPRVLRPRDVEERVERLETWQRTTPVLVSGSRDLNGVVERAMTDMGALRMTDPEHPDEHPVAAGAPWFMALFGRDSLLASYMAMLLDPRLASDTLRVLARHQGTRVDPRTEEQPGRILHETRVGEDTGLSLGGGRAYYGSIDSTPLFVMVLGELRRWGLGSDALAELLPAADRALAWCDRYGDRDGDGFLEYLRLNDAGLVHQGWKDSGSSVTFADGRPAEPPIALAEVQGYWYAALRARAEIAASLGESPDAWSTRAADLRTRFDAAFWLPEHGWYAMALDADKRPVDALTSNIGHCLWTGIATDDHARAVADALLSPEMFSGWGLRTLSSDMAAYDPMSYHNGAVWPHDTALAVAGLMRYGFVPEARTMAGALLDAASALDGRLPELFCGFDRSQFEVPIEYPASCSPQAWSAAAPVLLLRTLLQFSPDAPNRRLACHPVPLAGWLPLHLSQVPLAGARVDLSVASDGSMSIEGLPSGFTLDPVGSGGAP
jgi:glycogen debranching enzyme